MRGPWLRSACSSPWRRRSGLTLLEVLLSAGLGIILIGGIYAAIEQSWRMSASGKVELERQQVARAVLRQLTLDVRSAAFTAKPSGETGAASDGSSGSSTGGTSGGSGGTGSSGAGGSTGAGSGSSGSSGTTTAAGEEETQWTTSEGIRGTTTELMIDISHPRYLSSLMAVNGQMPSDLQTVMYAVGSPSAMLGSSSAPTSTSTSRSDSDGVGLFRSVTDRYGLQPVGATSSSPSGSPTGALTKQLAPEIAGLQFRYFDGLAWKTEWESITLGMLPRAIEVTIVFEPPPSQGVLTNTAVSQGTDKYRTVIPVPTSDPVLTEEAY